MHSTRPLQADRRKTYLNTVRNARYKEGEEIDYPTY